MRYSISILLLLFSTAAWGQQQQFAPIVIDAQKYREIDEQVGRLSMPREAHAAWLQLWQMLERQAQQEAARNAPPPPPPPPGTGEVTK